MNTMNTSSLQARFNLKKADWKLFYHKLQVNQVEQQLQLETAIQSQDFDQIASLLQQIVLDAAKVSIPAIKIVPRSKPWWTEKLTNLRMRYHRLCRHSKIFQNPQLERDTKAARNHYFHQIQFLKKQHWIRFLEAAKGKSVFTANQ